MHKNKKQNKTTRSIASANGYLAIKIAKLVLFMLLKICNKLFSKIICRILMSFKWNRFYIRIGNVLWKQTYDIMSLLLEVYEVKMSYICHRFSPRNENLNLLVQIKFLNSFFIYSSNFFIKTEKITGPNKVLLVLGPRTVAHCEEQSFTGLGPEDWCSLWGLLILSQACSRHIKSLSI